MFRLTARIVWVVAMLAVAGCGASRDAGPRPAAAAGKADLAASLRALGDGVAAAEAERAAEVALRETARLAQAYEIADPPLVHNVLVNLGLKPRGLCWHWADDLEARLRQEDFRTLDLHRAIANADNPLRIDHSSLVVSKRGGSMRGGLVLDPWREGGRLYWVEARSDPDYVWHPRAEVFERKRQGARRPDLGTVVVGAAD